jgi:hypothetical protein
MKIIRKKGEKMSLRKGLTLLLLAAFSISTVAPALAVTTVTVNNGVNPSFVLDTGTAANGAKPDVDIVNIAFTVAANGLNLGTVGGIAATTAAGITYSTAGVVDVAGTVSEAPSSAYFTAPAGCKFVKLPDYASTTAGLTVTAAEVITANINMSTPTANLANSLGGNVFIAQVLDATATGATGVPAGSLAIHGISDGGTSNTGGNVTITVNNIGLACDASASPATSGNLQMTYVRPTLPVTALLSLTDGQAITIGTLAATKKLEAILPGTTTGTVTGVVEPDAQNGTLVAGQITSSATSISFGPSLVTTGGATPRLDTDAIIIRSAEKAESTTGTKRFFQTPFATAAYTANAGTNVTAALANSAYHSKASLTADGVFTNTANSLITITFSLENSTGGSTAATLQLDNAYVGFHGNQVSTMLAGGDAGYAAATDTALNAGLGGFLGAVVNNVQNGSTAVNISAATDAGIIVVADTNNDGTADNLTAVDGSLLNFTALPATQLGGDTTEGLAVLAINGAPTSTVTIDGTASASLDDAFVFPGSVLNNSTAARASTVNTVGTLSAVVSNAFTGGADDNILRNAKEFYANLKGGATPAGDVSYVIVHGDETAGNVSTAAQTILGATNFANAASYNIGPSVSSTAVPVTADVKNNVLLASQLVKSGSNYVVRVLPLVNKYDNLRDVLTVRAKGVINGISPSILSSGVKLVATVSGNNLSTTKLTLAEVLPNGSLTTGLSTRVLPAGGTAAGRLMLESATNPANSRAEINPASVTGAGTTTDDLADLIGTGLALDTTVPPLFTGGVLGNSSTGSAARGPIPHVQPKGRVITIEEANTDDFSKIASLAGTNVIRVTFPTGVDINNYTAAVANLFTIFNTATFTAAPTIATVQGIGRVGSTDVTKAFVDISVGTPNQATTNPVLKKILLGIKPHALVVTDAVTDTNVKLEIINTNGTTNDLTDDTLVGTIGTASLGTKSKFLKVGFSNKATSAYKKTGSTGNIELRSAVEDTNGAIGTSVGTLSKVVRFVNTAPAVTSLPDLDITEEVADAIPLGSLADGRPASFAEAATGTIELHCATTKSRTTDDEKSGFDGVGGVTALVSDVSIDPGTIAIGNGANEIVVPLALPGTVTVRAADVATTITLRGLKVKSAVGSTVPSDDDIVCWIEDNTAAEDIVIGSNVANASFIPSVATTTNAFLPIDNTIGDHIAEYFVDRTIAGGTETITTANWDTQTVATTEFLDIYTNIDADDKLDNAIGSVLDNSTRKLLSATTKLTATSTDLPAINSVTDTTGDLKTTLSAAAGLLEPGTLIQVVAQTNPQGGSAESVTVPVLDNGSFVASLRATPGTKLTITQFPSTKRTAADLQIQEVVVPGKTAAFTGVVPTLLTSTIANKGTVVALFNTPAVTGFTFTDVEATAKVNGVAVTKVATGKYAAIVPATASTFTFTLTVTVDGEPVTTTLTLATVTATGKAVPAIGTVNVKADDSVVVNVKNAGTTFPSDLSFEIVYTDGTTAVVANSAVALKKAGARAKFANPEAAKTIAFVQAVAAGGSRAKSL